MTISEIESKYEPLTDDEMKRQIALGYGWGRRPTPKYVGVDRWLNDGSIIEFTNPTFTARNVEFEINNNSYNKIWLSQLQGVFINDDNPGHLYEGVIYLKDNTVRRLREFDSDSFWNFVKGKKFRVQVDRDAFLLINEKNDRVRSFRTYKEAVDYIFKKLDAKQYDLIEGMTKTGTCYELIEI